MASIGSFGRTYAKIELDFDWFEMVARVNPSCSQLALIEFLAEAGHVDDQDEVRSAQIIMRMMREVVHPDDFDQFWAIAKRERQDPQKDLMPLAQAVLEASTGFPTGQPSGSTTGREATGPSFTVDLPSQDAPRLDPLTLQGLRITDGRPDLQVAVLRAGGSRSGSPVLA